VNRLAFLRYHWLLATVGPQGTLRYLDVSTGENVAEHRTRLGECDCLRANPWNAVLHLGHADGAVTLWTPNLAEPVAKLLCHKGAVADIAVDRGGRYMATAGKDGTLKVWDLKGAIPVLP
jgi:U3 small nucleolar RNA-associated protein 7